MIQNEKHITIVDHVCKKVRREPPPLEIPWLTVREWLETLRDLHDPASFSDRVARIKATMAERIQQVEIDGKIRDVAGHVLWLDFTDQIQLYTVLESGVNASYFSDIATRRKILGLSSESVDISLYTHAQNEYAESGKADEELRVKLKSAMARKSRPLLSLKWDSLGQVMEIVWLQSFKGFDHYPSISGSDLKKIVELFETLLPPERMTILADQAKSGGLLLRKLIPLTRDCHIHGPGYYGSWGFIPSNCWGVKNLDNERISQSRSLYYSAVQILREATMDDLNVSLSGGLSLQSVIQHLRGSTRAGSAEAKKDFDELIREIYEFEQPPKIEAAKEVILRTVIWEKRRSHTYEHGYFSFCLFDPNAFDGDFSEKETYKSLVAKALHLPGRPGWLT